eukprot:GILK01007546.1.p1 GENE.GILK01007546.1~~GILK01007546.1.p1  ORF type:complete len:2310 (-),score=343.61 GILK01007546.1:293-7114(-)
MAVTNTQSMSNSGWYELPSSGDLWGQSVAKVDYYGGVSTQMRIVAGGPGFDAGSGRIAVLALTQSLPYPTGINYSPLDTRWDSSLSWIHWYDVERGDKYGRFGSAVTSLKTSWRGSGHDAFIVSGIKSSAAAWPQRDAAGTPGYGYVMCENDVVTLRCNAGEVIMVTDAFYGRYWSIQGCGYTGWWMYCSAGGALEKVAAACNYRNTCNQQFGNWFFGDPCWGTFKSGYVKWKCVPSMAAGGGALWLVNYEPNGMFCWWYCMYNSGGRWDSAVILTNSVVMVATNDNFGYALDVATGFSASPTLVVSAPNACGGYGCVYMVTLDISVPAFSSALHTFDGSSYSKRSSGWGFGYGLAVVGDLNGDGVSDIVIGAPFLQYQYGQQHGGIAIHLMNAGGSVKYMQWIQPIDNTLPLQLHHLSEFGHGLSAGGDVNNDGIPDIAVGSPGDFTTGWSTGAWYMLAMDRAADNNSVSVKGVQKFSQVEGKTSSSISWQQGGTQGRVGRSLTCLGDTDSDGKIEIIAGAENWRGTEGALFFFHSIYQPIIQPDIQRITPNHGSVSGGTMVTITGLNLDVYQNYRLDDQPCDPSLGGSVQSTVVICKTTNPAFRDGSGRPVWIGDLSRGINPTFSLGAVYWAWDIPVIAPTNLQPRAVTRFEHRTLTITGSGFGSARTALNQFTVLSTSPTLTICEPTLAFTVYNDTFMTCSSAKQTSVDAFVAIQQITVTLTMPFSGLPYSGVFAVSTETTSAAIFFFSDPDPTAATVPILPVKGSQDNNTEVTVVAKYLAYCDAYSNRGPTVLINVDSIQCFNVTCLAFDRTTWLATVNCTVVPSSSPVKRYGACCDVSLQVDSRPAVLGQGLWEWLVKPRITAISYSDAPTAGGAILTVMGQYFGVGLTTVDVTVSQAPCLNPVRQGQSYLTCEMPPGVGTCNIVAVTVEGSTSGESDCIQNPTLTVTYNPPTITGIIGSELFTMGGSPVNLVGDNFGVDLSSYPAHYDVYANSQAWMIFPGESIRRVCTITPALRFNTNVTCQAQSGTGTGIIMGITVAGQDAIIAVAGANRVQYYAPTIFSITPTTAGTAGSGVLNITGRYFGRVSPPGLAISIGPRACDFVKWYSDELVSCQAITEGMGINHVVFVTVDGQTGNSSASSTPTYFSYLPPTLTGFRPPSSAPGQAFPPSTSGYPKIEFVGRNVGCPSKCDLTQIVILINNNPALPCKVVASTDTVVSCLVPPYAGKNLPVSINVAGQIWFVPTFTFFSYAIPIVTSITPAVGPVAGFIELGVNIVIGGANFGPTSLPVYITIGGSECTSPQHVSDSQVRCQHPPGVGAKLPIIVSVAGQNSSIYGPTTFSYSLPTVASVTPTISPAAGGIVVTFTGHNFGGPLWESQVNIYVVSKKCLNVTVYSNKRITCITPPQLMFKNSIPVAYVETAKQNASVPYVFTYDECPLGTLRDNYAQLCVPCPLGRYSTNPSAAACDFCDKGRFANVTGLSSCYYCPNNSLTVETGAENITMCQCLEGFHGKDGEFCTPCPEGGICPGRDVIYPMFGYWGNPNWTVAFFQCNPPEACPGNYTCADHHDNTTRLCYRCLPKSVMTGGLCQVCPSQELILAVAVVTVAVTIVVLVIVMKAKSLTFFKICMSLSMTLSTFNDQDAYAIPWPPAFGNMLNTLTGTLKFDQPIQYALDCFIHAPISFFQNFMMPAVIPPVGMLFIWFIYFINTRMCMRKADRDTILRYRNRCIRNCLFLATLAMPAVSNRIAALYRCKQLDYNLYYLQGAYEMECAGSVYDTYKFTGIIIFIAYPLLVPVTTIRILVKKGPSRFTDPLFLNTFGFLFVEYKVRWYYWEGIEMFRKVLFTTALPLLYMWPPASRLALMCMISCGFFFAVLALSPYKHPIFNYVMSVGLMYISVVAYGGLLMKLLMSGTDPTGGEKLVWVLIALMLFCGIGSVAMLFVNLRREKQRYRRKIMKKIAAGLEVPETEEYCCGLLTRLTAKEKRRQKRKKKREHRQRMRELHKMHQARLKGVKYEPKQIESVDDQQKQIMEKLKSLEQQEKQNEEEQLMQGVDPTAESTEQQKTSSGTRNSKSNGNNDPEIHEESSNGKNENNSTDASTGANGSSTAKTRKNSSSTSAENASPKGRTPKGLHATQGANGSGSADTTRQSGDGEDDNGYAGNGSSTVKSGRGRNRKEEDDEPVVDIDYGGYLGHLEAEELMKKKEEEDRKAKEKREALGLAPRSRKKKGPLEKPAAAAGQGPRSRLFYEQQTLRQMMNFYQGGTNNKQ